MSRRKKIFTHYETAAARAASLKSIDTALDLGNGLVLSSYEAAIANFRTELDGYNTLLSSIDEKLNIVEELEKKLKDLSERMLAGVASKYGKNSNEYEKAGGVKKSERKRPASKKSA